MSEKDKNQDLIDRLRILPDQVAKAVDGLNDEQLDTPYGEGKWTIRQVVHHLADSHANANARFKLTMTEEKPNLQTCSIPVACSQAPKLPQHQSFQWLF